jgi:hypothetical protein
MKAIVSIFIFMSLGALAQNAGRINKEQENSIRCVEFKHFDLESCERLRKKAVKTGCITPEERVALEGYGSAPACQEDIAVSRVLARRRKAGEKNLKFEDLSYEKLSAKDKLLSFMTWCTCGCFHPETKVLGVQDGRPGEYSIKAILKDIERYKVSTLDLERKTSSDPEKSLPLRISSHGKEKKKLYYFELDNGRTLKVTSNHPIYTFSGLYKKASVINREDLLLSSKGLPVRINRIIRKKFKGEVLNFALDPKNDANIESHTLFAEDVAVGDMYLQGKLDSEFNAIQSRL